MSLFIGLFLVALVVVLWCLLVHYWRGNRILKIDLETANSKMGVLYDINDRYKLRIVELESVTSKLSKESCYSHINPLPAHAMVTTSALLAAEWGGVRVGESPIDVGCSGLLLYSPAGLLMVMYPTDLGGVLSHLPQAAEWDWHGAKHRLICESSDQVVADLLVYAKLRESQRSATASSGGEKECQTGA